MPPDMKLDDLLNQGLSIAQIEQGFIQGDFNLSDDDLVRLSTPGVTPGQEAPAQPRGAFPAFQQLQEFQALQRPDLSTESAIDERAAQIRNEIFQSGLPTEEIVAAQAKLREETAFLKQQLKGDPSLGQRILGFLSSGTDIGPIKVNIPLLTAGVALITGGLAAGAFPGAVAATTATAGALVSGQSGAVGLNTFTGGVRTIVPKVASAVFSKKGLTVGGIGIAGTAIGALALSSGGDDPFEPPLSPDDLVASEDTIRASLEASEAASAEKQAELQSGISIGTQVDVNDVSIFAPQFVEVDTPMGRAVVTMTPIIENGFFMGFSQDRIEGIAARNTRIEREKIKFEREGITFEQQQTLFRQQQATIQATSQAQQATSEAASLQQQLETANFLADPGNRLRLQSVQATLSKRNKVNEALALGLEGGNIDVSDVFARSIPNTTAGDIGALLGLDPNKSIPITQQTDQPFGGIPSFSSLADLTPDQLSQLNAISQISFGQELSDVQRKAEAKRLPRGAAPQLTFGGR